MLAHAEPLLSLSPERIEREIRAAEDADYSAAEVRYSWFRAVGVAARLWWASVWLLGLNTPAGANAGGELTFLISLMLATSGTWYLLLRGCVTDPW